MHEYASRLKLIRKMTIEELSHERRFVSRLRNKAHIQSEEQECIEILTNAIEKRESAMEHVYKKECREKGVEFIRCSNCGKLKPARDHHFGFGLTKAGNFKGQCKTCLNEVSRVHSANNPEAGRERARLHQNKRLYEIDGNITKDEKQWLRNKQDNKCAYCGGNLGTGGELDHYIPVDNSGTHDISNRVWACRHCNRDKGTKLPDDFHRQRVRDGLPIRQGGFFKPSHKTH